MLANTLVGVEAIRSSALRTRTIEPHARASELPLLVKFGCFFFFLSQARAEGVSFHCVLAHLSKRGNFGRLSAMSNHSSSYSMPTIEFMLVSPVDKPPREVLSATRLATIVENE